MLTLQALTEISTIMTTKALIRNLLRYTNLKGEIDGYEKIFETVNRGIVFRGTNLWILIFAIIVASVGLNMNSTAVIIGAMLISPLMGPINGIGYSIATYNFPLLRVALKNFSFAVIASLIASTAYFALSPISTAHSELLARVHPTIYDVLIAFFGGFAGMLAISSKQKGNVIPGVAIATALMPPLCTAGYGLATARYDYFFGAFYLFTINSVFIAIASLVVAQLLKFPITTIVDEIQIKRVNRWISFTIILVLIPSIYFGYLLVQKERFVENAGKFVNSVSIVEGNFLLKNDIVPETRTIVLAYGGTTLDEKQKSAIRDRAREFFLDDSKIEFQQGISFDAITQKGKEAESLKAENNLLKVALQEKEKQLRQERERIEIGKQILAEARTLYPQISTCAYAETKVFSDSIPPVKTAVSIFHIEGKALPPAEKEKIGQWLKARLQVDRIIVVVE